MREQSFHFPGAGTLAVRFDHKESIRAALEGYPCLLGDLAALDRAKADFIKGAFSRHKTRRVPFS